MSMGLPLPDGRRPWGYHLAIDLYGCDPARISDSETIRTLVAELVERIKMNAFGDLFLVRFALHDPEVAGFTAMQAIETSSITAHFAEGDDSAYLDVFSCQEFDTDDTAAFIAAAFGSTDYDARVLHRGRRRR